MGPPCEHGGRSLPVRGSSQVCRLQWGRRVNTAEGSTKMAQLHADMPLQWGRRVNTAEGISEMTKAEWAA